MYHLESEIGYEARSFTAVEALTVAVAVGHSHLPPFSTGSKIEEYTPKAIYRRDSRGKILPKLKAIERPDISSSTGNFKHIGFEGNTFISHIFAAYYQHCVHSQRSSFWYQRSLGSWLFTISSFFAGEYSDRSNRTVSMIFLWCDSVLYKYLLHSHRLEVTWSHSLKTIR